MLIPQYPKGDLRRMLSVLAAIDELGSQATMVSIGHRTGLDRRTVTTQIEIAQKQAGVDIQKKDQYYSIVSWGDVISKDGALLVLKGEIGEEVPKVESI
ncbi:hypothetical protein ACYPKM_00640 [Pseudomonas aeruginosa]